MLAYIHVHVHHSTEDIRPIRLGFRTQEEPLRHVHSRRSDPIIFTKRPESVTPNHRAVVGRASAVWECAAWPVEREFLGM
jgi:hypothetical protein